MNKIKGLRMFTTTLDTCAVVYSELLNCIPKWVTKDSYTMRDLSRTSLFL